MKYQALSIAVAAGVLTGAMLPLPEPPVTFSPASAAAADQGWHVRRSSAAATDPVPATPTEAAALAPAPAAAALRAMLDVLRGSEPVPQEKATATALFTLLLRLDESRAAELLYERRLPAWLMASAWIQSAPPVPPLLWEALFSQPGGLEAAQEIVQATASSDAAAANALQQSLPAAWRQSLRRSYLLGIAAGDPASAIRQAGKDERFRTEILSKSAAEAPIEATVRVLIESVETAESGLSGLFATLLQRDAALTRRLITEGENPKLLKALNAQESAALADDQPPVSPRLLLQPGDATPEQREEAVRMLAHSALQNPEGAKKEWEQLPEGRDKDNAALELVMALGENDPAEAFRWSAGISSPSLNGSPRNTAMYNWMRSDAPAAVRAVLALDSWETLRVQFVERFNHPGYTGLLPNKEALLLELTDAEEEKLRR